MLYVFEAIKNHFHTKTECKRLCREIYLESRESPDKTARTQPCIIVEAGGAEVQHTDKYDIETYELSLIVFSNKIQTHVPGGILEQVRAVKLAFDEQIIDHPTFITCRMSRSDPPQPDLVDGTYQATLGYSLTVVWNQEAASMRYVAP